LLFDDDANNMYIGLDQALSEYLDAVPAVIELFEKPITT